MSGCWWNSSYGYSYYCHDGLIYHNKLSKSYADSYTSNDTIDIWLDLKTKYELSFSKNGKLFGKAADVSPNATYRLAIAMERTGAILELFHFYCENNNVMIQ